jgi:hypothetical protein
MDGTLVEWQEKKVLSKVPEQQGGLRQKVDDFFTNYLRNTTSDQEIRDFYGEGNIVGRKGIPATDKELLDTVQKSSDLNQSPLRPDTGRQKFSVGGIDQQIGYDYKTGDIPGAINPDTGRPWQMTFGALPKDFGAGSLTPAAKQFLVDFRVPINAGNDYSFATGPNIKDRIETETKQLVENDPYYGRSPAKLQDKINEIQNQSNYIGEFSGQPQTPKTWQERGYITQKPSGFKENVLSEFKNKIFETQGPFGGVSTLTPVEQRSASNPDWRANLYEKEGLAGPVSSQSFSSGYGGGSKDVQRFVTGSKEILPLQPYAEFFQRAGEPTAPSALGTTPAPDFTPLQKTVGTRNYLIGKNILEGRGNLGAGFRSAVSVGAADLVPSREAVRDFYEGKPLQGFGRMAGDFASGIPTALATGAAVAAAPALAPFVPGIAAGLTTIRVANAADEASRRQTGEGLISKFRQTLGTAPRTGYANSDFKTTTQTTTPQVTTLSPQQRKTMEQRQNRNELQKRVDLFKERFNPSRGEFGFSELVFGR